MKKIFTYSFLLLLIISSERAFSQCPFDNSFYADLTPPASGATNSDIFWGGEYATISVVLGETYIISTCGMSSFDSQITLYDAAGATVLGFNDDFCGLQSEITWTATYTGVLNVLIDEWDCVHNTTDITLNVTHVISATVNVSSITVAGQGGMSSVNSGAALQMVATVLPANATNPTVTWSVTNNSGTATIDPASGLLTGTIPGSVTVCATATDGTLIQGCTVINIITIVVPNNIGVAINTDNSNPDPSALLDVKSTEKGVLVPRMTGAQKMSIPAPALGLLVYQTDGTAGFYYYNGSSWVAFGATTANIYSSDGALAANRTVAQGSNTLSFTSTAVNGFSVDGNTFSVDANNDRIGIGTTTPAAKLDILGTIKLSDGTQGNGKILTSDGAGYASWQTPFSTIYSGNGSLTGNRVVAQGANTLSFTSTANNAFSVDGATFSVNAATNEVGIGTSTPTEKLDVAGTVKLGVNGTTVTNVIKTTVNRDVLSIAANAGRTVVFAVPNAALTSTVYISPAAALANGLIIAWARVSAVGTVQVRFQNVTTVAIDPAAMDYYITVIE